jgi:hypothetical protein
MAENESDGFAKANTILAELVGNKAVLLDGSQVAEEAQRAITNALRAQFGEEKAADIAFHLTDWNSDAAFIVALLLFPDRFTPEEIEDGILGFACHAPNHVAQVAKLMDFRVEDIFSDD